MNLEDLRERRRREREQDSLGRLPESFYRDAAEYVADLKRARERAAARADDPYGDPEVRRLTDELDSATSVVESLYERRVGKVVKHASFAAADMPHDDEGLTEEERALFDDLVERIRENRSRVLGALEGDTAEASAERSDHEPTTPDTEAETHDPAPEDREPTESGGLDSPPAPDDPAGMLAEAMGGGPSDDPRVDGGEADARGEAEPRAPAAAGESSPDPDPVAADEDGDEDESGPGAGPRDDETAGGPNPPGRGGATGGPDARERPGAGERPDDDPADERTTVRITADVGEIYGVDDRSYRLEAEDVVSLPTDNATPLVEKDAAERL